MITSRVNSFPHFHMISEILTWTFFETCIYIYLDYFLTFIRIKLKPHLHTLFWDESSYSSGFHGHIQIGGTHNFSLRSWPRSLISDSRSLKYFMDNSVSMYKIWPLFHSPSIHPSTYTHSSYTQQLFLYPFMDLGFWKPKMHPCLFIYPNHCCFMY